MTTQAKPEVLITEEAIRARILELGREISECYRGKEVAVIVVLKGSFIFAADLVRAIDADMTIDFLGLASYGDEKSTSGVVKITSDLTKPVAGKEVLIVEDIVDTGLTLQYLLENLKTRKPAGVKVCSLLHKPTGTRTPVEVDFLGFTIEDQFVVGYGLDDKQRLRQLPYVGVVSS